jgi:ADP-heptose:LPS heptosyltransferase
LGNTLLLTPLVQDLEARFPDAQIELVTSGRPAPAVFAGFKQVSAIHAFPARSFRSWRRVLLLMWKLRRRRYDLAIDPEPRSRAGRFLLGLVSAQARVGFSWGVRGRDRMLTQSISAKLAPAHSAQYPLFLLESAFGPRSSAQPSIAAAKLPLSLHLTATERLAGIQSLATALGEPAEQVRGTLAIYAHATDRKCYPVEWWRQLVAVLRLEAPSLKIIECLPDDGRARLAGEVPTFYTRDLRHFGAVMAATSLIVIADCGVMHLADAAGARVIGLFKVSEPSRYGPGGSGSESLRASDDRPELVAARILQIL